MRKIQLVIDLVLDESDTLRLQNTKPGYLYLKSSEALYLKHLNHMDFHPPNLVLSYGKENHELVHLPSGRRQKFLINHQELDEFYSVALGVTDHLAMLALGDSHHTRIQVVDVNQVVKVFYNKTYMEPDTTFFPVPRYFSGNPREAILVYSDNSRLAIDLETFEIGKREPPKIDQIVRSKTILDPKLSIFGPFIILTITEDMTVHDLSKYRLLLERAAQSSWIMIDDSTVLNTDLVTISDFDELIAKRQKQLSGLLSALDALAENE